LDTAFVWIRTHIGFSNYKKSRIFDLFIGELEKIYNREIIKLADLNIRLIKWLSSKVGINTKFVFSSQLDTKGSKTNLLIDICKKLNGEHYLSPAGSKNTLKKIIYFQNSKYNYHIKIINIQHTINCTGISFLISQ